MEDENKKENEEIKVVEAFEGERKEAYFTRLKILRDKGEIAYGKWWGTTFSINTEIGPEKEYALRDSEREREERKLEEERKEREKIEAPEKVNEVLDDFLKKYRDQEEIPEEEILSLFSELGKLSDRKLNGYWVDFDEEKANQLIGLLEARGYKSKERNELYKTGSMFKDLNEDEKIFRVGNIGIICNNGEDLTKFSSSDLAKFAIENGMTQLSFGSVDSANMDFLYTYKALKKEENGKTLSPKDIAKLSEENEITKSEIDEAKAVLEEKEENIENENSKDD